jgi:hypothetical protein
MPNHIKNIITCNTKEELEEVKKACLNEEGKFDFEKIIPMPDTVSRGEVSADEMFSDNNWYGWRVHNWGTKWNAYDQFIDDSHIEFSTAWSTPDPIWEELAKKFPNVHFHVEYACEFLGNGMGIYDFCDAENKFSFKDGDDLPNKDAVEMWCRIWNCEPEDIGAVFNKETNEYEFPEPEDE